MQMRDDLGITTKLENGKAYLEFVLPEKIGRLLSALQIRDLGRCGGRAPCFHRGILIRRSGFHDGVAVAAASLGRHAGSLCLSGEGAGKVRNRGYGENMGVQENEGKSQILLRI